MSEIEETPSPHSELGASSFSRDLLKEVIGDIATFRDMEPEEDESWESWYFAAFDMLIPRVIETFDRNKLEARAATLSPQPREEARS